MRTTLARARFCLSIGHTSRMRRKDKKERADSISGRALQIALRSSDYICFSLSDIFIHVGHELSREEVV